MKGNEYDERYLAMFQPGGESRPWEAVPPGTGIENFADTADPAAAPGTGASMAPPAGSYEPTFSWKAVAGGLGAALAGLLAGSSCLLLGALMPSARAFTVDPLQGMASTPWGMTLAVAAAPLITSSLAAMAAIPLLAARQPQAPVAVLRRSALLVGVATLVLAALLVFNETFFPAVLWWNPEGGSYPPAQVWNVFAGTGKLPLATLGLAVLTAVYVDQPRADRGPMAGRAIRSGGLLLAAGFIMNFATHLFPDVAGSQIQRDGSLIAQTPPWTYSIASAAGAGMSVGAAALLLGISLAFMPRQKARQNAMDEDDAAAVN